MYVVYKLTTPDGVYIGVTGRALRRRASELQSRFGFVGEIEALAKFYERKDALALEAKLRPACFIGLNRGPGGYKAGGATPSYGAANGSAKRVRVEGVEYPTAMAAAQAHNLNKTTAYYRFHAPTFPAWVFIEGARA